jgi:chromosome segregation ATPase
VNQLATRLLATQLRRQEAENRIGVEQEHAEKGEADLRQVQLAKEAQDNYIASLAEEMDQLTAEVEQCRLQTLAMETAAGDTTESLKKAEAEIQQVKAEHSRLLANWTNTVIHINKRDEALVSFQAAVEHQKTELRSIKARIEGMKNDIVASQTEHEMMTGIKVRLEHFCSQQEGRIKKTEKETTEEQLELGRLGKVRQETEVTLTRMEADLKAMEAEDAHLRQRIQSLETEHRDLEAKVLTSLREQMTNEKNFVEVDKQIKEAKARIKTLESLVGEERNKLAMLEKEMEDKQLKYTLEKHKCERLAIQASQLEEEERKLGEVMKTTSCAIERVQSLINIAQKEFRERSAKLGEETSPLEAEIKLCQEELELLTQVYNMLHTAIKSGLQYADSRLLYCL